MKAVIMAGGKGTRLSEITKNEIPKALAEVAGKPLLWHQIWRLKENGIIDITLVVGHLKEKIISYLGNGEQFGVHVHYIEDDILLGTAGALYYLKNEMADDFLLLFGDIVFDVDIERMVHFHKKKNAVLTLYTHPNSYPYDSDLVMFDKDHRVTAILKKTDLHPTFYKNCVNASFFIVNPRSLAFLKKPEKMDMEKDFVSSLVRQGERVYAYHATEYLKDAGTPERIASASRDIQDGVVSKKNLKNEQECIFLDRDGTLNKFVNFLSSPAELELLPGVAQAVKSINDSGFLAIVVTNQSVVARGKCKEETLCVIHDKLETLLAADGAYLDDILYCPHHPNSGFEGEIKSLKINCECRKPKIGMLQQAAKKHHIDLTKSWMVGDSYTDILTGKTAGAKTIKLPSEAVESGKKAEPDYYAENLSHAIKIILGDK